MMPPFQGELSAEERWTLAGFVKSLRSADNLTILRPLPSCFIRWKLNSNGHDGR